MPLRYHESSAGIFRRRAPQARETRGAAALVAVGAVVAVMVIGVPAASARRDPRSPQLRPVSVDVRRATRLLLSRSELPHGFHTFKTGASTTNNVGACHAIVDPDLSALTETAEVYGAGLANTYSGVLYFPAAYVFVSAKEAARAQALDATSADNRCAALMAKKRLQLVGAQITASTYVVTTRRQSGVSVIARQAVLGARVDRYRFKTEASLIFLRRGRELSEILTSGPWNAATHRTWEDAIDAVVRNLRRYDS